MIESVQHEIFSYILALLMGKTDRSYLK